MISCFVSTVICQGAEHHPPTSAFPPDCGRAPLEQFENDLFLILTPDVSAGFSVSVSSLVLLCSSSTERTAMFNLVFCDNGKSPDPILR